MIADLLVSRQRPLTPIHERDEAPIPAVLWPQDVIAWSSGLVCLTAEKGRDFKLVVVDRGIDLRLHGHDIGGTRRGCRSGASAAALIGALAAKLRFPVVVRRRFVPAAECIGQPVEQPPPPLLPLVGNLLDLSLARGNLALSDRRKLVGCG